MQEMSSPSYATWAPEIKMNGHPWPDDDSNGWRCHLNSPVRNIDRSLAFALWYLQDGEGGNPPSRRSRAFSGATATGSFVTIDETEIGPREAQFFPHARALASRCYGTERERRSVGYTLSVAHRMRSHAERT